MGGGARCRSTLRDPPLSIGKPPVDKVYSPCEEKGRGEGGQATEYCRPLAQELPLWSGGEESPGGWGDRLPASAPSLVDVWIWSGESKKQRKCKGKGIHLPEGGTSGILPVEEDRNTLILNSYAKINLGLKILGKIGNYHRVETILQSIDLRDRITFSPRREGVIISSSHLELPQGEENLCYRACRLLSPDRGMRIAIEKRIPVGGGLGGGSSNAAVTLWALNRIWNLGKSREELLRLAAKVGSDVPFFLLGGTVLCQGRGDVLKPLPPLQGVYFLLVNPGFQISTSWAYSRCSFGLTDVGKFSKVKSSLSQLDLGQIPEEFPNDLERVVANRYPVIKRIKEELYGYGALAASLSGSGPTVWGLFKAGKEAREAAESLHRENDWWIKVTHPIDFVLPEEGKIGDNRY